jgi:hypothetical protein
LYDTQITLGTIQDKPEILPVTLLIFVAAQIVLLVGAAFLMVKHKSNPDDFDKFERAVNVHVVHNKYLFTILLFGIISTVIPGAWGMATLAQGKWLIGGAVLLIWVYPYWLLLKYLSNRALLKMRLGFSLTLTLLVLALAVFVGKMPNPSINTEASDKAAGAGYIKR